MSASYGLLEGPLLENIANNLSPGARRRSRYERRQVLWDASSLKRARCCGRVLVDLEAGVRARLREGVAGWAGLQHCASVWVCPVCASRILVHRALEIGSVLQRAVEQGYALAFCTFTMRHHLGQDLALLWSGGQKAWQAAISGKYWQAAKALGVVGWVRVWEVGYGRHGWHVHVHFVLVLTPAAADRLDDIAGPMWQRWDRSLRRQGLDSVRAAQDWHVVRGEQAADDLGGYLAKLANSTEGEGLGLELTHGMPGRAGAVVATRPTWAILDHLVLTGEAAALEAWHEWERVSKGKRQVGWSKGLRERFAPEVEELTDDEVVAEELGTAEDDVLHLDVHGWRALMRSPGRPLEVLELLEIGGVELATSALDQWGIRHDQAKRGDSPDGDTTTQARRRSAGEADPPTRLREGAAGGELRRRLGLVAGGSRATPDDDRVRRAWVHQPSCSVPGTGSVP